MSQFKFSEAIRKVVSVDVLMLLLLLSICSVILVFVPLLSGTLMHVQGRGRGVNLARGNAN